MIKLNIDRDIYLISDIHANINLFKKAISKLDLNFDYLFILGDIIEKGDKNIETLDYIMYLTNTYKDHVFVIIGNCDKVFDVLHSPSDYILLKKYSRVLGNTILNEFLDGIGENKDTIETYDEALDKINIKYKKYFNYINSLDREILINNNILLTHADKSESINKKLFTKEEFYNDYTLNIVGHMPVMMYKKKPNLDPLKINDVLYIDGGNNVVVFGGLNLVKLNVNTLNYSFETFLNYKTVKVKNDQNETGNDYIPQKTKIDSYINYSNYVKVKIDNKDLFVLNENFIDNSYVFDALNIFLGLEKGEEVYLCKECGDISLIIKDNTSGLVYTKNLVIND